MAEFIGEYIRQKLRDQRISNKRAGEEIGLSESAVEKILVKNDINVDRFLKLSALLQENLLEFYYDKEPLRTFRQQELDVWHEKISAINYIITIQEEKIKLQEELLETQRKLIEELEKKHM